MFRDRSDAGKQLALKLAPYKIEDVVVIGLARGGVVVAQCVSKALGATLVPVVVRKIGAPYNPELGIGAITASGELYLNETLIANLGIDADYVRQKTEEERSRAVERLRLYQRVMKPCPISGKTVIIVDDGLATGATMRATLMMVSKLKPARTVMAIPVGAADTLLELSSMVDETVCLLTPPYLEAIGYYYQNFEATSDEEVMALLTEA